MYGTIYRSTEHYIEVYVVALYQTSFTLVRRTGTSSSEPAKEPGEGVHSVVLSDLMSGLNLEFGAYSS